MVNLTQLAVAQHLGRRRERRPRLEPSTGEMLDRLELPAGTPVTGLESDGRDLLYGGGGPSGKLRAIRRPRRKR